MFAQQAGGFQAGGGGRGGFGAGGGPGGAGFGAGGAQPGDYGDTLVDLIERTISADIWDSAGGPAVIRYYQPNQALIISAPTEVHDNISDLLRQLRATASP